MEGQPLTAAPPRLLPQYWWPRWNSVQSLNKFQEEVGGPLRGGEPGVRLLEPGTTALPPAASGRASAPRPSSSVATSGIWRFVAAPQIFGSEELSARSPAIAERAPAPFVLLGAEDADKLRSSDDGTVEVWVGGETLRLPVLVEPALQPGTAAIPLGLPGLPYLALPATGEVRKP
jgi:NADH-quinone oxidoreductase subunit G